MFFISVPGEPRQARYRLENDPSCGIVTGGREECWWKCDMQTVEETTFLMPPTCMADCFPADHCLSSLLADYQAIGGICRGSSLDVNYPGLLPVSDQPCEFYDPEECGCTWNDYQNGLCTWEEYIAADCTWWRDYHVKRGLCSNRTKELLSDRQSCNVPANLLIPLGHLTMGNLLRSLCDEQASYSISRETLQGRHMSEENDRLIPIESIIGYENDYVDGDVIPGFTIAKIPPLQHTKHRYPWICSLRSVGQQSTHLCGVTLLSRPPGPVVLVTSAHCVYICKSEEDKLVPNCCCPNVGPGLCTDTQDCGTNATTVVMTGADAEVKCGEWDTATDTEEDYDVILPILKITVHPDFNISRGEQNSQFVANDLATIHVSDDNFEAQSRTHNINPICLPSNNRSITRAVHSGWSKPPPLDYVTTHVPWYLEVFGEFSKQWHYSMQIRKCKDPQTHYRTGAPMKYPSNSYYPPGTVCAVEREGKFCPTSGESGSPLMVTDDEGRMVVEGINSFTKVLKI